MNGCTKSNSPPVAANDQDRGAEGIEHRRHAAVDVSALLAHDAIDAAVNAVMEAPDHALAERLSSVCDAMAVDFAEEEQMLTTLRFPLWDDHMIDHSVGLQILSDAILAARRGDIATARRKGLTEFMRWSGRHRDEHDAALLAWVSLAKTWKRRGEATSDPRLAAE